MNEGYRNVIGLDIDPGFEDGSTKFSMCKKRAQEMKLDAPYLVRASSLDVPFPDDQFDLVLSNFSLMLLPSRMAIRRAISENRRVLKRGGMFYGSTISINTLNDDLALERFIKRYKSGRGMIFLSEDDIGNMLADYGFIPVSIEETVFQRKGREESTEYNLDFLAESE